ncbi:MAG: tetratricopeptide repeat protein [bacterium]
MKYRAKHTVSKADLRPDRFQALTEKVMEFYYRDRRRFLVIVGVVVAVVVVAVFALQSRRTGPNPEAQLRFTEALGVYSQGMTQEAEEAFRNVASAFGRDPAGVRARYYLGQIYFHNQRFDEARAEFERFLKSRPNDPILAPAALVGIADCLQETGDLLKAAEHYERAWRRYPDSPLAEEAALAAGRNFALAGALDRAERLYQTLLDKEPTGELAENLKMHLSYVQTLKEKF